MQINPENQKQCKDCPFFSAGTTPIDNTVGDIYGTCNDRFYPVCASGTCIQLSADKKNSNLEKNNNAKN